MSEAESFSGEPDAGNLHVRFGVGEVGRSLSPTSLLYRLGSEHDSCWKHDNMKLPAGDENRKVCSLYLGIMDRMGVKLDHFGDADNRLVGL